MKTFFIRISNAKFPVSFAVAVMLSFSNPAKAINYTWTGSLSENWNDAGNWTPFGIPGTTDNISILPVTIYPQLTGSVQIVNLTITGAAIDLNGFNCTATGNITITGSTIGLAPTGGLLNITAGNATSVVSFTASTFNVTIGIDARTIALCDNVFNQSCSFVKNGIGVSASAGGNIFQANTSFTNNGSASMQLQNSSPDFFNGILTLRNTSLTAAGAAIYLDVAYSSAGTVFNNNVILESTTGTTYGCGIRFGENGGSSSLNPGFTVSIGPAAYNIGRLSFKGFIQKGATPQQLVMNYAATTQFSITGPSSSYSQLILGAGTEFQGNVRFSASNPVLSGCLFNGPNSTYIAKIQGGSSGVVNAGGNIFNSAKDTLLNSTTSLWTFASVNPDVFNGDVVFEQTLNTISSPVFRISNGATSTFSGNFILRYKSATNAANAPVQFGNFNNIFSGGSSQTISRYIGATLANSSFSSYEAIPRMVINKMLNNVTLHSSMNGLVISSLLTMTSGNFITSANAIPIIDVNGTVSGTSDNSYVTGPITKRGNSAFVFPVGKSGLYRPIAISAPGSITTYTAEYFDQDPNLSYAIASMDPTLGGVSNKEYWMLSNTGVRDVSVTLSTGVNSGNSFSMVQLVVVNWDGSQWLNMGNGGYSGTSTSGTLVTAGIVTTSFTPFTLGIPANLFTYLPAGLTNFSIRQMDVGIVRASFTVLGNAAYDSIMVEHSVDGVHYKTIGKVKTAYGNNSTQQDYTIDHSNVFNGISYYRLRLLQRDGKASLSPVRKIYVSLPATFTVFPNPARSHFMLKGSTQSIRQITLLDCTGLTRQLIASGFEKPVAVSHLPPGIYWLKILLLSGELVSRKIILN